MVKQRRLYTLDEWDRLALLKKVSEPPISPKQPATSISCPGLNPVDLKKCNSHLFDLALALPQMGFNPWEKFADWSGRKWLVCRTCGWMGTRLIAKSNLSLVE